MSEEDKKNNSLQTEVNDLKDKDPESGWSLFWDALTGMGGSFLSSGITMGAGVLSSLIGGEESILESLLPDSVKPFAAMARPLVKVAASAMYDAAMGYDKAIHPVRPSAYVGNRTPAQVEARALANRVYKQFVDNISDPAFAEIKKETAASLFRLTETVPEESEEVTKHIEELKKDSANWAALQKGWRKQAEVENKELLDKLRQDAKNTSLSATSREQAAAALKEELDYRTNKIAKRTVSQILTNKKMIEARDSKSAKWTVLHSLAGHLTRPVEDAQESVLYDYHKMITRPLGVTATTAKTTHEDTYKVHSEFLEDFLKTTYVDNFHQGVYGHNSAEDIAYLTSDVVRRNATALRGLTRKYDQYDRGVYDEFGDPVEDSIELVLNKDYATQYDNLQDEVFRRSKAFDRLRSVYGKNSSAETIVSELSKSGLSVANMSAEAFEDLSVRMEKLAVNSGVTKENLQSYAELTKAHLAAVGLDSDLYTAGMTLNTAALAAEGTTVNGYTKSEYVADLTRMQVMNTLRGGGTDMTAALDMIDSAERAGTILEDEAKKYRQQVAQGEYNTRRAVNDLGKKLKYDGRKTDSFYQNLEYSKNRDKAQKYSLEQQINKVRRDAVAVTRELAKNGGAASDQLNNIDEDWLAKAVTLMSNGDQGALLQHLEDVGIKDIATFKRALQVTGRSNNVGERAVAQFISNGPEALNTANTDIPKTIADNLSRNNIEAVIQVMSRNRDVSASRVFEALLGNIDNKRARPGGNQYDDVLKEFINNWSSAKTIEDKTKLLGKLTKKIAERKEELDKSSKSSTSGSDTASSDSADTTPPTTKTESKVESARQESSNKNTKAVDTTNKPTTPPTTKTESKVEVDKSASVTITPEAVEALANLPRVVDGVVKALSGLTKAATETGEGLRDAVKISKSGGN